MTQAADSASALYRKLTWRLMPFILILYLVCYVDRVNIGFAKLQFLSDLGLNDAHYGFATGLFFVTYSLFDIPSNLMLSKIGVRKTLLRIMLAWGLLTSLQMFIKNAGQLYALRLLFGAAEAGFLPGIMLYLTFWFPDKYRGRVTSLFLVGVPLAGIVGGPISGIIMQGLNDVGGLRGWQWLFLLEGLPAIALGVIAYFYLQDGPDSARWLNDQERAQLAADLENDGRHNQRGVSHSFGAVFKDPMIYAFMLMNFAVNSGVNAVSFWTPSLLKTAGLTNFATIGWVTGFISLISATAMLIIGRSSDRRMERKWHLIICAVTGAFAFFSLPLADGNVWATATILTVAAIGNFSFSAIYWTIPTSYLRGNGKAGGIAAASMFGAIGSGVSPTIIGWLKVETGSLYVGLAAIGCILLGGAFVGLIATTRRVQTMLPSPALT